MNKFYDYTKKLLTILAILTLTFFILENHTDISFQIISFNGDESNIEEQY